MPIRLNRVLLFVLYGIAALLAWHLYERLYGNRGQLVLAHPEPGTLVMSWHREIKLPMAKLMADAYAANEGKVRRIVIDLDSPGGSLDEGAAVIALIQRMKAQHEVDTRVTAGHACLSMCVPIFLQGEKRLAAPDTRWLFHAPRSVDYFSGKDVKTPRFEQRYYAREYFDTYFRASPIDKAWLKRNAPKWQGRDFWRTGAQLYEEGSNIIAGLI